MTLNDKKNLEKIIKALASYLFPWNNRLPPFYTIINDNVLQLIPPLTKPFKIKIQLNIYSYY